MTLFCPLNQPQCKRSIMTASGPFEKKECPLSKGRKCPFTPAVCPAFRPSDVECYWPKIQGVMKQGGCKVKPNPLSQWAAQCCKVQKAEVQNADMKCYPPENCAELPPCGRCSFGHPKEKEKPKEKTKKKKMKESFHSIRPSKVEDAKQKQMTSPTLGFRRSYVEPPRPKKSSSKSKSKKSTSKESNSKKSSSKKSKSKDLTPKNSNTEDSSPKDSSPDHSILKSSNSKKSTTKCYKKHVHRPSTMSGTSRQSRGSKQCRSGCRTSRSERMDKDWVCTKTRRATDCGVENLRMLKSSRHRKKREETQLKLTAPEKREEIFRKAINDKVGKLQNREHLVVPQCSSASRRLMPCTTCLVDLLGTTGGPSGGEGAAPDANRCRLQRVLDTCTAFRVPSVCPGGCPCPDVAPLEEEADEDCPFSQHQPPPTRGCPLSRLPAHPLILDPGRTSSLGANFDPCKCPIVPGDCCYTLPGCPVHTMRAIIDCPNKIKVQ